MSFKNPATEAKIRISSYLPQKSLVQDKETFSQFDVFTIVFSSLVLASKRIFYLDLNILSSEVARVKNTMFAMNLDRVIFAIFQMTISSGVYLEHTESMNCFKQKEEITELPQFK